MNRIRNLRLVLIAAPALLLADGPAFAQERDYGPRDIGGSWERYPTQFSGTGSDPDAPAAPQLVPDPPLKPEHYGPWRRAQDEAAALSAAGLPPATNYTHCVPDGMPAMMAGMFPMEVLDTGGQITIIQEAYNQVRRIYVGEDPPAPEDAEPRFSGHSGAHWDGDVLVVETTGVKEYVGYRNVPHSTDMRITERISLLPDRLYMRNEISVIDPDYMTAPWTWTWMYKRWPGYRIQEYVCEDNLWGTDSESGAAVLILEPGR